MEPGKHLGIIKAKAHSIRCPAKNLRPICGRPMLHWTLDVMVRAQVFDLIVISTVDEGADELKDVVHSYRSDSMVPLEVFVRDGNDPEQIEIHGFDYTARQYSGYKFCTGLFGSAWFVKPSWIRAADRVLRSVRAHAGTIWDYPVTHVDAFPGAVADIISSWRLDQCKWVNRFYLELRGCIFDLDTVSEFTQTEKVMAALLETDYFDRENIHLEDQYWETALAWNQSLATT